MENSQKTEVKTVTINRSLSDVKGRERTDGGDHNG